MKLYHGSSELFDRFDSTVSEEGMGRSENGFGINLSDSRHIPWEYANGERGGPGVIYEASINDRVFHDTWLIFGQPIGQEKYDKIISGLDKHPNADTAGYLRMRLKPTSTGFDVMGLARLDTAQGARFIAECGIGGFHNGETFVVFKPEQLSPLKIESVHRQISGSAVGS